MLKLCAINNKIILQRNNKNYFEIMSNFVLYKLQREKKPKCMLQCVNCNCTILLLSVKLQLSS